MFTELCWSKKIYVIFLVARRYGHWSSIATAGAITAFIVNMEAHIRVASSIQEHKTGPFSTTADVKLNLCWIDVNNRPRHLYTMTWTLLCHLEQGQIVN